MEGQLLSAKISSEQTVTCENITTSRGPATSISFALEIIRIIKGEPEADAVAKALLVAP
jgi:4-methyl-5(b-hydroxyethyl)-thiazole monophosphate biosynthesis